MERKGHILQILQDSAGSDRRIRKAYLQGSVLPAYRQSLQETIKALEKGDNGPWLIEKLKKELEAL